VRLSDFAYLQDIISDNGDLRRFLTLYNVLKSLDVSFDNLDENIMVSRNIAITKSELLNLENKIQSKMEVLSHLENKSRRELTNLQSTISKTRILN
jgi:chemotaxis protein histidine kinase CheA